MRYKRDSGSGNRRDFLKAGLRACALGGLALTGAVLGLRTAGLKAGSTGCMLDPPCRRCRLLAGCPEPRASRARGERLSDIDRPSLGDGSIRRD